MPLFDDGRKHTKNGETFLSASKMYKMCMWFALPINSKCSSTTERNEEQKETIEWFDANQKLSFAIPRNSLKLDRKHILPCVFV